MRGKQKLTTVKRRDLVRQGIRDYCYWRAGDLRKYIKAATGVTVAYETVQNDINEIRRIDQSLYTDMARGGSVHIISNFIKDLGTEISSMMADINNLNPREKPIDPRWQEVYEQLGKNKSYSDLVPILKEALNNNTLKNVIGKKSFAYEQLDKKRQFLLDILEAYPIHAATNAKMEKDFVKVAA